MITTTWHSGKGKAVEIVKKINGCQMVFLKNRFIYLFLAVLGLCCFTRTFSSCGERRLLFIAVSGGYSHCVGFSCAHALGLWASVVVAHGLSCSKACGISPDQGLNSCFLHWQMDAIPLHHQGNPGGFLVFPGGRKWIGEIAFLRQWN